jgi:hypothetical protein
MAYTVFVLEEEHYTMELLYAFTLGTIEFEFTIEAYDDHDTLIERIAGLLEGTEHEDEAPTTADQLEDFFNSSCVELNGHNLTSMVTSFEGCFDLLQTLEAVGERNLDAYLAYCLEERSEFVEEDTFTEAYQGHFSDGAEFAEQLTRECYDLSNLPDFIQIDWAETWEQLSTDYTELDAPHGRGVFIFRDI